MSAQEQSQVSTNGNRAIVGWGFDKHYNFTEEQVAWALYRNHGQVINAARTLQCSARTIHAYLRKSPALQEVLREARTFVTDTAEQKLVQAIRAGNLGAITFWLKTQAGWSEKRQVEHSGPGGGPIQIETEHDAKLRREIVAAMVRGHLENGYTLAEALKNVVLLGIPKDEVKRLTRADIELRPDSDGAFTILPEEGNSNGDGE